MDYGRAYDLMIGRARDRVLVGYGEWHHVVPRCMGGGDTPDNLVKLTAREHYVAHALLARIHNTSKMWHAFAMMSISNRNNSRVSSSRHYAARKTARAKAMMLDNPMADPLTRAKVSSTRRRRLENGEIVPTQHTADERQRISERMKGDNNPSRKYPDRNQSSVSVMVEMTDGSVHTFPTKRACCAGLGIPRSTLDWCVQHGVGTAKHSIKSITNLAKGGRILKQEELPCGS